ncbi:transglycosylase domain-containing protein [Bradyrhizobium sp. TZ2]
MDSILIKIFATALAFSQVTTRPDGVKTEFDAVRDRVEVAQLLSAGCAHMRKAFDIEDINLDDLIATAMDDKEALSSEIKALKGLNLADLHMAYRQFCKVEKAEGSPVDLGQVIAFYNSAVKDLPDAVQLKNLRLPGMSVVLDNKSERLAEIYVPNHRRVWVKLADIPEAVRNAFIAAEDKRFFQHAGIDERGLVRAFIGNFTQPSRPQGGSTITQQVAKNLLVGNDITYERKLREMIVASRMERALTKAEILELYLNSIYLGRGAWGIEMAARSYFGKSAKALSAVEGALLAGLAKGPNYFNPDHHPERARAPCLRAGPHAGRRHDRRRRGASSIAAACRVPADATGLRLSLRRSHRPRGKGGRGPRYSHQFLLHGALDRQLGLAAHSRSNIAGGPRAVRAEHQSLQI